MGYNSFHCIKALRFSAAEELRIRFEKTLCLLQKNLYAISITHLAFSTGELQNLYLGATKIQRLRKKGYTNEG